MSESEFRRESAASRQQALDSLLYNPEINGQRPARRPRSRPGRRRPRSREDVPKAALDLHGPILYDIYIIPRPSSYAYSK